MIKATKNDDKLIEISKMIQGIPYGKVDGFENIRSEIILSTDGLVLKGNRIVIPQVFQNQLIRK